MQSYFQSKAQVYTKSCFPGNEIVKIAAILNIDTKLNVEYTGRVKLLNNRNSLKGGVVMGRPKIKYKFAAIVYNSLSRAQSVATLGL